MLGDSSPVAAQEEERQKSAYDHLLFLLLKFVRCSVGDVAVDDL